MKRFIENLLGAGLFIIATSCADDKPLDELLADTEFGIALRSIDEVNGFDLSDRSSMYTNQFELDAVDEGFQPQSIRVLVGFTDDDETEDDAANSSEPTLFDTPFDVSSFTETTTLTTHDLPVGTLRISLGDALTHLGLSDGDYDRGDAIEIELEMVTTDGTVFNSSNVGTNVASSGTLSFYRSAFRYTAIIDDPNRVVLTSAEVGEFSDDVLMSGETDTVQLIFDASTLVTDPVITRVSANDRTDDVIGAVQKMPFADEDDDGTDDNENVFFFLYTAGLADSDMITFQISGAETNTGFPMEPVTFEGAFEIDNVAPVATLGGASGTFTEDGAQIDKVSIDIIFSEELTGDVSYTIASPQFDTITIDQEVEGEAIASLEFRPRVGVDLLSVGNLIFTVSASGAENADGIDEAGNPVVGDINVSLF